MSSSVLRRSQIAPEPSLGSATAPARQLAGALSMVDTPERRLREQYRNSMRGPGTYDDMSYSSEGSYRGRVIYDELPYFLASSIDGTVAPTGRDWTFTQPATINPLKSLTVYVGTNIPALRAAGVYTRRLEISGTDTDWWRIDATLIGNRLVSGAFDLTKTTPLSESPRNKTTILSIDETGAAIGGNPIACVGYSFRWVYDARIEPDYCWTLGNLDYLAIQRDTPQTTLEITAKWSTETRAEWVKAGTLTTRFIRLENSGSDGTNSYRVRLDGAYKYVNFVPLDSERNGTQLARLSLEAVEDATWAKKIEVSVQCNTTGTDLPVATALMGVEAEPAEAAPDA